MSNMSFFSKTAIASAVLLFSFNAHALLLEPPGDGSSDVNSANQEEQLLIDTLGLGDVDLDLYYKANFDADNPGTAIEADTPFAGTYTTTWFLNSEGESNGADIVYDGLLEAIACPSCYAAVKDGNNEPAYYFFDISSWNGTETLEFRNFWQNINGSISHISLWGNEVDIPVPEPGTLGMLGLGLMGLGLARRRVARQS